MLKKALSILFALVLVFQFPVFASGQAYVTQDAAEVSFPFFTDSSLIDLDTGQTLGGSDVTGVSKNANVSITYDFSIPDAATVTAGSTYAFTVPSQIKLAGPITDQELRDSDGNLVAYVNVTAAGVGTITFTDFAETHRGVGGMFTITAKFNESEIANTQVVQIPIDLGNGRAKNVDVYFDQPNPTNAKAGVYDPATGTVAWTITLNSNATTVKDGVLTDDVVPGGDKAQTYVDGTFKVMSSSGATMFDSSLAPGSQGTGTFGYVPALAGDVSKTGTLSYTFASAFEDKVTVTFTTKLTDPSQYFGQNVANSASLAHDGTTQSMQTSVYVNTPNYLQKTGRYNTSTGQLDWVVLFDPDGLSLHNVKVTDALPVGLSLDTSSVRLDGVASSSFTYTNDKLTFDAHDISSAHTLTFSTNLPDGYWQQNHSAGEYSNTAVMTADDNAYLQQGASGSASGVGPSNSVIRKTSLGYDVDTHRITWQVIVNADRNTLPDASITDTIGVGQKYLPGTFTINADAPVNSLTGSRSFSGSLPADPATTSTVLRYNFGAISSTYTITYKTEVIDPTVWAGNTSETLSDSVVLDPGNGVISTSSANQALFPDIIQKAASYDYATHEITWMIDVDESQIPSTGVVVTENLTGGGLDDFALETSTIVEEGVPLVSDPADYPAVGAYHYDASTCKLTINLGNLANPNPADRTRTITFKMKLAKTGADYDAYFSQNGDKVITNTANVTSNQNPHITSSSESQTIHNTLVGKEGYYSSGHAYIDWAVEVNQNQIALNGITLTDTLQQGLELDTSSIQLYAQTLNPDGSLSPVPSYDDGTGTLSVSGTPIGLTAANVSYDATTRKLTFTMPDGVGNGQPCLLVFRTTVDASYASGASFSNAIDLKSSTYFESTTTSSQWVGFSSESGTAWGTTGDVTVTKRGSSTDIPLAGAVFGLYDAYGNLVRISSMTGDDGQTVFAHINCGVLYTVRELTAPADHELSVQSYSFKLDRASGKVQLCDDQGNAIGDPVSSIPTFSDAFKVAMVTFTKLGDGAAPLSGAVFTLCDANGEPVQGFPTQLSGADGTVTFTDVPYGDYLVKETNAPIGYHPLTIAVSLHDSNDAIVTEGTSHRIDLGNQQDTATGSLVLTKLSAEYADGATAAMPGIMFQVLNSDGQVIQTQTTGQDGKALFADLPVGSYTLHEETTPANYQVLADHPFTISAFQSPAERQIATTAIDVKKSGTIKLIKVDSATGDALQGATFTLYDASGEQVVSNAAGPRIATSDASGNIELDDVPYGDYQLKETIPAQNHAAVTPISIHLVDGGVQVVGGTIDLGRIGDTLLDGIIRFVKTDGATPLAGAEFELSGNGIAPQTAISDTSGAVAFAGVPYSNDPYIVSEMKTPADYYQKIADFQVILNDVSANADRVLQLPDVVDIPLGSITLTKKDAAGVSVLPGATFELLDAQGGTVQTQTTDQDGKLTFAGVALNPVGDTLCTLHEASAPVDYALAPDQTVKLSNTNGSRVVETTVSDALKTATIQLLKVDQSGTPLQGATFTLYDASLCVKVLVDGHAVSATSGTDGLVRLTDIPYGDYELVETMPPSGYTAVDPIAVSLHDGASCLSNGVFDLGVVQDASVFTALSQNGIAPNTGDVLASPRMVEILATMGLVGAAMLCVAVGWARKGKRIDKCKRIL